MEYALPLFLLSLLQPRSVGAEEDVDSWRRGFTGLSYLQ